jgi:hypothetical protein
MRGMNVEDRDETIVREGIDKPVMDGQIGNEFQDGRQEEQPRIGGGNDVIEQEMLRMQRFRALKIDGVRVSPMRNS